MKIKGCCGFICFLIFIFLCAINARAEKNILLNSDFLQGDKSPSGWEIENKSVYWDKNKGYLKYSLDQRTAFGEGLWVYSSFYEVKSPNSFLLKVKAKSNGPEIIVFVEGWGMLKGKKRRIERNECFLHPETDTWQDYRLKLKFVNPMVQWLRVKPYTYLKPGIVYFDSIELIAEGNPLSAQDWWNENWQFRKVVEISAPIKKIEGEKAAVVDFTGKAAENGQDIRVVDENNQEIPYFLVSVGEGNEYQISFPAEEGKYFIYYGNKDAEKLSRAWRPKAGLLLSIYKREGTPGYSRKNPRNVIEESRKGELIGRSFWKKVWDRGNPFGPQKDIVRIYNGYFSCQRTDQYSFATSSAGPSFLLIDDKLVASWPGWHRAEPFVRPEHSGSIHLEKGIHRFTYAQIGRKHQEISVAAIKLRARKRFIVIPERFFIPLLEARVVKTEKLGKNLAADFGWENTNYLKREKWELLTFAFRDSSSSDKNIVEWQWDFGDGQKSNLENPSHTYLLPGIYPVSLSIKDENGETDKVAMKVKVEQDYAKIRLSSLGYKKYLKEFKKFDLEKLGDKELAILGKIFLSYDQLDNAYLCCKKKISLTSAELAVKTKRYPEAEKIYRKILEKEYLPEVALKLANLEVEMGKLDAAMEEFTKIEANENTSAQTKREAEIGFGDLYRIRGNYEGAKKIYEKLTAKKLFATKNGAYTQAILYYLKKKDFSSALEKLTLWGEEIPLVKLHGSWSILRARAYILEGDYKKALKELDIFQKICPDQQNPYLKLSISQSTKLHEKLEK